MSATVIDPSLSYSLWLASLAFFVTPILVNLVFVVKTLKQELSGNDHLAAWLKDNAHWASFVVVVGVTQPEALLLLSCGLARPLSAPWSPKALASIRTSGLYSNLLEDLPQLCIQAIFARQSLGSTPFSSQLSM